MLAGWAAAALLAAGPAPAPAPACTGSRSGAVGEPVIDGLDDRVTARGTDRARQLVVKRLELVPDLLLGVLVPPTLGPISRGSSVVSSADTRCQKVLRVAVHSRRARHRAGSVLVHHLAAPGSARSEDAAELRGGGRADAIGQLVGSACPKAPGAHRAMSETAADLGPARRRSPLPLGARPNR